MLTFTASDLRQWQTCRRRWLLERSWRVIRWRPRALYHSCLREGVFQLSSGADPASVRASARTRFLEAAANPGLEVAAGDPWYVAQDWAAMLSNTLTAIARLTLLTLSKPPAITISEDVAWLPLSTIDDSGTLHRWITCDAWDEETLAREAHSWHAIADMVMLDAPLMIHAIDIGRQREGRRHSPWARCWLHPVVAGLCRFQRPDGKGGWRPLRGEKWKVLWYVDQTRPDPEAWVDLMERDHVTQSLLHHQPIAQPSAPQASRIRAEILRVVEEMRGAAQGREAMEEPMARTACDPIGAGPCPWQLCCYGGESETRIGELGLYERRGGGAGGHSSPPLRGQAVPSRLCAIASP